MKKFSLILIARDESECGAALAALAGLDTPASEIEVLIACGRNPSAQRNQAAQEASGEFLVFLDNDSIAHRRLLRYYEDALDYEPGIDIVGGPSLYEGPTAGFKSSVQAVFSSVFGLGPFRWRYMALGLVQRATEEKLILCNLLIRRDLFLRSGGFDTNLYPNEENEFLNRVRHESKAYYHPLAVCYREPRATTYEFCRQMINYGKGRARHLMLFPRFMNAIFLLPTAFSVYIATLPLVALRLDGVWRAAWCLPLLIYSLFNFSASVFAWLGRRNFQLLLTVPPLFLACHFCYGLGLIVGVIAHPFSRRRQVGDIQVRRFKAFGESWANDNVRVMKAS